MSAHRIRSSSLARASQPLARILVCVAATALPAVAGAVAVVSDPTVFNTELLSMDLSGNAGLPLGRGQNSGYAPVQTTVHMTQSPSLRSIGQATVQDGPPIFVQTFFDVFFDITITDVDPSVNFAGHPDGAVLRLSNQLAGRLAATGDCTLAGGQTVQFCLPLTSPYIGFDKVILDLGFDVDGNGANDWIHITHGEMVFSANGRLFVTLPDGTVIQSVDGSLTLQGGVEDVSNDPPFGPIVLTGPTTASSRLVGQPIPEPSISALFAAGLAALALTRRRRAQTPR